MTRTPSAGELRGAADCRVAIFSSPVDRAPLAAVLRDELHVTEIDARIRARSIPGLLPERLSCDDAEHLVDQVRTLGLDADAVRSDELPDLRHAPQAHHVRCTAAGLEVVPGDGGETRQIAWQRVALISVADVPLDESHHSSPPRTVMFRGTPRRNDAESTTVVRGPELWLGLVDPYGALRIDHREMNYEYLGERMTGSATANFEQFLADLRRQSPHAILTPSAQAFVDHDSVEKYRFATRQRHRELVELFAALVLRDRRRSAAAAAESPADRTALEPVMNPEQPAGSSPRLAHLHEKLNSEIDLLNAWVHEADEYGRPQFGQLGDRVMSIRDVVAEHFALEEDGGYFAAPVAAAPELADRAAALRADHPRLLAEFDALAAKLRDCPCSYDCWSTACQDFQQLLAHVHEHEHRENDLWQEAFDAEPGAGD